MLPAHASLSAHAEHSRHPHASLVISLALLLTPALAFAQQDEATLRGTVTDSALAPLSAAVLRVAGTRDGAVTDERGRFIIAHLAAGRRVIVVRRAGFASDTFAVTLQAGQTTTRDVILRRGGVQQLSEVVVKASPRLNETREQALERQRSASNLVSVLSGDEIRALPNANAAEAIARMPGISTERDEGEGKFVQIRGTEPRLSNVTVNGAHLPGTETGNRVAKLDDVPTDILGAIEVAKTLTADMDADAIGGSVNLVTKTPEGAPRGYVATQYGRASLLSRTQGQGSLMYGGRFGTDGRLGALLGGTYDKNNRAINDLELAWNDDDGRVTPGEWDQRDYLYERTRYGMGGDVDYRFDDGSSLFLKGLWSKFNNFGTRYRYDVALGGDSSQAASGVAGIGTGAQFVREVQFRTPQEQLWGFTSGGKKLLGAHRLDFTVNYSGTRQSVKDYRTNSFEYDGPNGDGLAMRYDGSNRDAPSYQYLSGSDQSLAVAPANYAMTKYSATNGLTTGRDLGGALDLTLHLPAFGDSSALKLGAKYRDEAKSYVDNNTTFVPSKDVLLSQVVSTFSDPSFYHSLGSGFDMGPVPSQDASIALENANGSAFVDKTSAVKNALASFSGGERVSAAYAMHTSDFGALHLNLGLRLEHTAVSYSGNVMTTPGDSTGKATGPATIRSVPGTQSYTDLFPSVQLRYAATPSTNVRVALTRGIARANYTDLAPHVSGEVCSGCERKFSQPLRRQPRSPSAARLERGPARRALHRRQRRAVGRRVLQGDLRLHLSPAVRLPGAGDGVQRLLRHASGERRQWPSARHGVRLRAAVRQSARRAVGTRRRPELDAHRLARRPAGRHREHFRDARRSRRPARAAGAPGEEHRQHRAHLRRRARLDAGGLAVSGRVDLRLRRRQRLAERGQLVLPSLADRRGAHAHAPQRRRRAGAGAQPQRCRVRVLQRAPGE